MHTLTICIGFIDGDHVLGLRKETEKHWGRGEGWKMQALGWGWAAREAARKGAREKQRPLEGTEDEMG